MIILGIHGGPDFVDDNWVEGPVGNHDASAALIRDGELVAAAEEERFNRFKHTNKAPVRSIEYCLREAGLSLADVDVVAIPQTEADLDGTLLQQYESDRSWRQRFGYITGRTYITSCLERLFGVAVHPNKLYFTHHHVGHAASTYYASGFERALVMALDGYGGALSGIVAIGCEGRLRPVRVIPGSRLHSPAQLIEEQTFQSDSLGLLYLAVTEFLGFQVFDEYKVMGLAPYGDPRAFRSQFRKAYTLLPEGRYRIHWNELKPIRDALPRPAGDGTFEQIHKDAAAGVQAALTDIVLHMLRHLRSTTDADDLCLAGGVGLNCTLNGEILRSQTWRRVFVQPAAGDGGLALGAALDAHYTLVPNAPRVRFEHVYLGPDCGSDDEIDRELQRWTELLAFEPAEDVCSSVAAALAGGAIVGWVQGRMEFGPRALGNRSILADPRPRAHIALINEMIKKREAFRPFAPAVLEEHASSFFDMPSDWGPLRYMLASVQVRDDCKSVLGATTHVDGSARIQVVRRSTNPLFWKLIHEFYALTGVPVLLNTSFNNNSEPIVGTARDAIVCFLTTDLTLLVIGRRVARKRPQFDARLRNLVIALSPSRRLRYLSEGDSRDAARAPFSLSSTCGGRPVPISAGMFALLSHADGAATVDALVRKAGVDDRSAAALLSEIKRLWSVRAVQLVPRDGEEPPSIESPVEPIIRELLAAELHRIATETPVCA